MPATLGFAAIDLGAESGRLMLGRFDGRRLSLEELHRFDTRPVRLPGGLFTDVANTWRAIVTGLSAAAAACGPEIDGVGVDTWGVDFALLDSDGGLLSLPYHYPRRAVGGHARPRPRRRRAGSIFAATGVQFLPFNSLYQLLGLRDRRPSLLSAAARLLFLPNLFTHWLGAPRSSSAPSLRPPSATTRSSGRGRSACSRAAGAPGAAVPAAPRAGNGCR